MIDSCPQDCQRSQRDGHGDVRGDGRAGTRLKTFGGKTKRTISTFMEDVPTGSRIVVYAGEREREKRSKTAHVKAKERSHPSYIHSSVQACTQTHTEGHIYIKCTRVFGQSIRLKPTLTTVNPNNMFKRNRGGWKSSHPRMTAAGRELLT